MANPTVRMIAIYVQNKKAATVHQVDYKINPARTAAFGQEGYLTHAKGSIQTEITLNEVTPVAGSTLTGILKQVLDQEDLDCAIVVGAKQHRIKMAVTGINFQSQSENGMSNGSMTLAGGVPDVQL